MNTDFVNQGVKKYLCFLATFYLDKQKNVLYLHSQYRSKAKFLKNIMRK
ncbi:hypothetical protein MODO_2417 [Myroides odoratimimus]|nr:hypothetical protein MODO_2417 [Myroides odoratimimus]